MAGERQPAEGNPPPVTMTPAAVELRHINKSFGPVKANRDVSLRVAKGSIHGIKIGRAHV